MKGKLHSIYPEGEEPELDKQEGALDEYVEEQYPLHAERFISLFIDWITHDDITFQQAASPHLREIIIHSGQPVKDLLPCATTTKAWILKTFKERKPDVKANLKAASSRINFSCDSWKAPNDTHLFGIVAHWLDNKKQLKTALLGLRPERSRHGVDMAPLLRHVIDNYGIGNNLGAFQMDNADNNDTCLQAISERYPSIDPTDS